MVQKLDGTKLLSCVEEMAGFSFAASLLGMRAVRGAVFGASLFFSKEALKKKGKDLCQSLECERQPAQKTLLAVAVFFGSYAISWSVLAYAGISLSLLELGLLGVLGHLADRVAKLFFSSLPTDFLISQRSI